MQNEIKAVVFIPLTQGKVSVIDFDDFEKVRPYKWCAHYDAYNWYAERGTGTINGKQGHIKLHQFLMPGHRRIDHKDGDGLNNTRGNLRPASHGHNVANSPKKTGLYNSRYKGVSKEGDKWRARLRSDGVCYSLGLFAVEEDAARAYDKKARETFGEFASPNFPL